MNANTQPLVAAEPLNSTDPTVIIPRDTALSVLTNADEFDAFYARVKATVDAHVPDVTTAKGRDAIKALAFKVTKSKTAIDNAGKELTEEWREQTKKVDAARKAIRDRLDALRDEVRRPVTEWEAAEEARIAEVEATMGRFQAAAVVAMGETATEVAGRLADIEATKLDAQLFGDMLPMAEAAVAHAKMVLEAAVARLTQEEADRAELDRLRAEAAERQRVEEEERAERMRAEAAATAARIAAEAEERRKADEATRLENERLATERATAAAAAQAEERARAKERQRAEEAVAAERRASEEKLAQERREREAAEAETARLRQEEEARQQAAEAQRRADEARAADRAHRGKIMGEAKSALMAAGGIGEEAAKKIVLAIAANEVPAVSIRF